jgi:phosphate transport system substrate-binding protein
LLYGGLILLFAGELFYQRLLLIGVIIVLVLSILSIFNKKISPKIKLCMRGVFLLGIALSITVSELHRHYEANLRISVNDFNLAEYELFNPDNKLATLDEPSTLVFSPDTALPKIDGATALYPLYAALGQALYPKKSWSEAVRYSNTMGAYTDLVSKKVDVIFVAQPSEQQLQQAKKNGVTLKLTPIGKEAFVFFINANNPVDTLTVAQLQDIYAGKVNDWSEVGGKKGSIIPFQRNENSGSQTAFLAFMKGRSVLKPKTEEVSGGMGGIVEKVSDYKNYKDSIGFSFRFFLNEMVGNKNIKLLQVNGISPDKENIQKGTYPLTSNFYAVSLE